MVTQTPTWGLPLFDDTDAFDPAQAPHNLTSTQLEESLDVIYAKSCPPVASLAKRDALFPTPTEGNGVYRTDLGYEERYRSGAWRMATAGDVYLQNTRTTAYTMNSNGVFYILGGEGSPRPVFGVPTSHSPLSLVGDTYSNGLFKWNRVTGVLNVVQSGVYELELRASASVVGSGSVVMGITKNSTTVGATTNDLARADCPLSPNSAVYLTARNPGVLLSPTDDIRFISVILNAPAAVLVGGEGPYAAHFKIRRISA